MTALNTVRKSGHHHDAIVDNIPFFYFVSGPGEITVKIVSHSTTLHQPEAVSVILPRYRDQQSALK